MENQGMDWEQFLSIWRDIAIIAHRSGSLKQIKKQTPCIPMLSGEHSCFQQSDFTRH